MIDALASLVLIYRCCTVPTKSTVARVRCRRARGRYIAKLLHAHQSVIKLTQNRDIIVVLNRKKAEHACASLRELPSRQAMPGRGPAHVVPGVQMVISAITSRKVRSLTWSLRMRVYVCLEEWTKTVFVLACIVRNLQPILNSVAQVKLTTTTSARACLLAMPSWMEPWRAIVAVLCNGEASACVPRLGFQADPVRLVRSVAQGLPRTAIAGALARRQA